MERTEFISKGLSDTWDIGDYIGRHAKKGEMYLLKGELGAGKTQLVKGIARGLGVKEWQYVVSPSFTLMNIYEGADFDLCHVDLYRIEDMEIEDLQIEEFLDSGIVVVEWSDKRQWDNDAVKIEIYVTGEEERNIVVIRP
ncbi:MAG TPA: tRNA (adenosine(37)-N6)-threonylcarbamoyltransferase complex ATPase subunit type 1 TsaE [Syntrophorhabdaceae bacterium]|nr:tRNA (adenosine(37)-N6)-threonylcarbamoyltransferase complex ATPase subunit type 1 TsaE [Syntrophorhabdaceae bacterium]